MKSEVDAVDKAPVDDLLFQHYFDSVALLQNLAHLRPRVLLLAQVDFNKVQLHLLACLFLRDGRLLRCVVTQRSKCRQL